MNRSTTYREQSCVTIAGPDDSDPPVMLGVGPYDDGDDKFLEVGPQDDDGPNGPK